MKLLSVLALAGSLCSSLCSCEKSTHEYLVDARRALAEAAYAEAIKTVKTAKAEAEATYIKAVNNTDGRYKAFLTRELTEQA